MTESKRVSPKPWVDPDDAPDLIGADLATGRAHRYGNRSRVSLTFYRFQLPFLGSLGSIGPQFVERITTKLGTVLGRKS